MSSEWQHFGLGGKKCCRHIEMSALSSPTFVYVYRTFWMCLPAFSLNKSYPNFFLNYELYWNSSTNDMMLDWPIIAASASDTVG